jgi:type II secretory pathway component GspD/PulD (secretin)
MEDTAIVHDGKFIKIVPLPEAARHGSSRTAAGEPGFGISVVPLRYISAAAVAKAAENILARQGAIRVDRTRNILLIQGTTSEREAALDLISTFDVEWLRHQSVGVYPLRSTSPETMIAELQRVFDNREDGPGHDVISFLADERHHGGRQKPEFAEADERMGGTLRARMIRHSVDARAVTEEFRDKPTTMKNGASCVVSGADVKR